MTPPKPVRCPECDRKDLRPKDGKLPIHAEDPGKDAPYIRCQGSLRPVKP